MMSFCGNIAAETPQEVLAQFEGMTATNAIWLQNHPEAPKLYNSGVRYQREGSPELWFDVAGILAHGYDDCEGLACWRAAELRNQGYSARPVLREYKKADGGRLYHCLVEVDTPDGPMYDDPSARLGMLRADNGEVSGLALTRKGVQRDIVPRASLQEGSLVGAIGGRFGYNDRQKFGGAMVPRVPRLLIKRRDGRLAEAETLPEDGCVDLDVAGVPFRLSIRRPLTEEEAGFVAPLLMLAAKGAGKALTLAQGQQPPQQLPAAPPGFVWAQVPTPPAVSGPDGPPPILEALRRLLPRSRPGMSWTLVPAPPGAPTASPLPVAPVVAPVYSPPSAPAAQATTVLVPGATALRRGSDAVGDIFGSSNRVDLLIDTTGATYDARGNRHLGRTYNPEEPRR